MTKQEIIEEAFKNRDISILRKYKKDSEVDFSFSDNILLRTIAEENLHVNYLKLLTHREECDLFYDNFYCFLFSLKNNNKNIISFFQKHINVEKLINNKNISNILTVSAKSGDFDVFKNIFSWISFSKIGNNIDDKKIIITKYFEESIEFLLSNFSFGQCKHIFENYNLIKEYKNNIILRKILLMKDESKKQEYLTFSKKHFFFIKGIDKEFIDEYTQTKKDYKKLKDSLNNYLKKSIRNPTLDLIEKRYTMTNEVNDFYHISKIEFISGLFSFSSGKYSFDDFIINSIKENQENKSFMEKCLRESVYHDKLNIFNFIILNFKTKIESIDFGFLNSCYSRYNRMKNYEYFCNELSTLIQWDKLICVDIDMDSIYYNDNVYLFKLLNDNKKIIPCPNIYITITRNNAHKIFDFCLCNNISFKNINNKFIQENIINDDNNYVKKLMSSLNISNF